MSKPLKVLTWHVHGNYLHYLSYAPHTFYLPTKPGRPEGYGGRRGTMPWRDNLVEIKAEDVREADFDVVLYQSRRNWEVDRHEILSAAQRELPSIYLEHDPPRDVPTDTPHPCDDPSALVVHCTHFNDLMWDCHGIPTRVIEHGVTVPDDACYTGEFDRGIAVVNDIASRGRRLGADVFARVREQVPMDLAGMGSLKVGGIGELEHGDLPYIESRYRFFFNPIRYTSLGLSVLEAMMLGMPVLGLATTEMVTAVENGVTGYVETDVEKLVGHMRRLLRDPEEARLLGERARVVAQKRFGIERFAKDWDEVLTEVAAGRVAASA